MRYHVFQFSDRTDNFDFFGPNLPKKEFLGWKFRKLMLEKESASLRYHVCSFLDKTDNFDFSGPNLPKNGFWGRNFENLSLGSSPPRNHHQDTI